MDCIDGMKLLDDNCIDTIITDPPYGLEFMGKKWDYDVPSIKVWKESLRVLKPGGTLLCFAGSRTQHRMACNIEDAGYILKDCIIWLYGSGFPKATDISKQLDKGHKREKGKLKFKGGTQLGVINDDNWKAKDVYEDNPATPEAKLWNGWKSHGLKPAYEPILVAMKPNDGSYANNALKWGVSGLNIDGGRIGTDKWEHKASKTSPYGNPEIWDTKGNTPDIDRNGIGRYPANVILDEEAAKMLDKQSGITISSGGRSGHTKAYCGGYKQEYYGDAKPGLGDKGGASRFFYCAKASKSERNAGVEELEKNIGHNRFDKYKNCGGYVLQNPDRPSACKCEKPEREHNIIKGNYHPTVKPLKLMEYLCKLTTTPTGGIVLDPFMGSGTTALASRMLNRHFIGFEIDEKYYNISLKRLLNVPKRLENWIDV